MIRCLRKIELLIDRNLTLLLALLRGFVSVSTNRLSEAEASTACSCSLVPTVSHSETKSAEDLLETLARGLAHSGTRIFRPMSVSRRLDSCAMGPGGPSVSTQPRALVVPKKNRRKSNSERGKEFRAKRREYETSLLEMINSLREEVRDLRFLREIRGETSLVSRSSLTGSLAKLIQEYFTLFARGRPTRLHIGGKRESPSSALEIIAKQNRFIRESMDPTMKFGGVFGAAALLDQWERYTLYHSSFRITIVSMEISGPDEAPIITVISNLTVKLSRETFIHIFPHVADDDALVSRLIGTEVTYRGINRFQFGPDHQRVLVYESDVDFVNAFLSAGVSLSDVALLMQQALIADQHLLGEEPTPIDVENIAKCCAENVEEAASQEACSPEPQPKRTCQDIAFLLN